MWGATKQGSVYEEVQNPRMNLFPTYKCEIFIRCCLLDDKSKTMFVHKIQIIL